MTQSLKSFFVCLFVCSQQISPLRPQRPRSQVLNQLGGDRRLSVSPGPTSSSSNSCSSPGPPPITPRSKPSFSLHNVSSENNFILLSLSFQYFKHTQRILGLALSKSLWAFSASLQLCFTSCITVTTCLSTCDGIQLNLNQSPVHVICCTSLNGHANITVSTSDLPLNLSLSLCCQLTPGSHIMNSMC